ncbi:MAG: CAP domain-containing protein, partial [Deltaproteobacteria bacterium]|nr:CAP domain-containing protein [Deltaproteobacteria bacterium]
MTGLLLAAWLSAAPTPLEEVERHFDRHGRSSPRRDAALEQAAARLADRALDTPAAEISAQASVTAALSAA